MCEHALVQWETLPLPDHHDCHGHQQGAEKECSKPHTHSTVAEDLSQTSKLAQLLYASIVEGLADYAASEAAGSCERDVLERMTMNELMARVWPSLATLFVARGQLELVGVMRRTVRHTSRAVDQVSAIQTESGPALRHVSNNESIFIKQSVLDQEKLLFRTLK